MAKARAGVKVEIEFGTYGGGSWTNVTGDVRMGPGVRVKRGIRGNGPKDRTAQSGTATFVLNNAGTNSGGVTGYYSPDHPSVRTNFRIGKRVRISLLNAGIGFPQFTGSISAIMPEPGARRGRGVVISCVDFIEELALSRLRDIPVQVNKRGDQLIGTVLDSVTKAGATIWFRLLNPGQSTFVYSIDSARDESMVALQEIARIVQSEFGYFYQLEGFAGPALVFEDRHQRYLGTSHTTNQFDYDDTMCEMAVSHTVSNVFNRVEVTAHPRRLGASSTDVLYTLQGTPSLGPGESTTIRGAFTDPTQRAVRIGALSTETITATTDYTFNAAADGGGTNLTADLTVVATVSGNSVLFTVTNTGGTTGYITKLQIRGQALFDDAPIIANAQDSTSIAAYGERTLKIDMPYQDSAVVAQGAADFFLDLYKDPHTYINAITLCGNISSEMLDQIIITDIGTRIGIAETVTGLELVDGAGHDVGFFVQGVDLWIGAGNEVRVTYNVVPAVNADQQWILGVVGSSELGETTVLSSF